MGRPARRTLHGQDVIAEWSDSDLDFLAGAAAAFERQLKNGHTAVSVEGAEYRPITELAICRRTAPAPVSYRTEVG
jgi:hypothetical protein